VFVGAGPEVLVVVAPGLDVAVVPSEVVVFEAGDEHAAAAEANTIIAVALSRSPTSFRRRVPCVNMVA
jgi:hypothetical protein